MTRKEVNLESFRSTVGSMIPITGQLIIVTTIDKEGQVNAALKSDFMRMVSSPPIIGFSCNLVHHTAQNILENQEFVINIIGEHILEQALETGKDYPKGINELEKAGLTAIPSKTVAPPQIAECPVHLECREEFHKTYDDEIIIFGRVVTASIEEEMLHVSCEERYRKILPVFPLGERKYTIPGEIKQFPGW